jgi:hypothetical protein
MKKPLAEMSTKELITLHKSLEDRDDLDLGPINQLLADIETVLINRGDIDRLVRGY